MRRRRGMRGEYRPRMGSCSKEAQKELTERGYDVKGLRLFILTQPSPDES
jgi:hypothetical protein